MGQTKYHENGHKISVKYQLKNYENNAWNQYPDRQENNSKTQNWK